MSVSVPMTHQHIQVGAPDPELRTSPIADGGEDDEVEPNVVDGLCYFNNVSYRVGDCVLSGDELLRCEAPGLWVPTGEALSPRPG